MKLVRAIIALALLLATLAGGSLAYAQYKASQITLPPLKVGEQSVVLASDSKTVLGHIASTSDSGKQLTDDQAPALIKQAHMAAEDRGFYAHGAISLPGMAWALATDVKSRSLAAGGSTITQQFVKNAYLSQAKTADRKANEVIYSYKVEKEFSKDQILTMYVNSNFYGRGAYGVEDGAEVWFGVSATAIKDMNKPLDVARAAFLAALVKEPSVYDDYNGKPSSLVNAKSLYGRVTYVLNGLRDVKGVPADQMVPQSVIDQAKKLLPLKLTDTVRPSGQATDGNPYLIAYARDWLTAWQIQVAKSDGYADAEATKQGTSAAEALLARGGLRIVTSINPTAQKYLEQAVAKELPKRSGLAAGAVVQDPTTGGIIAMYGGSDGGYNYALYANRQVGSTMKMVVLTDAVTHDISVQSVLPAPAYIQIDGSKIYNDDHKAAPGCQLNLADAMAVSNNPVHIELITGKMADCNNPAHLTPISSSYPVSPASVAALARKMGADDSLVPGATNPAKLDEVPTLALGVSSLTPVKMVTIASTLANEGVHTAPYLVDKVIAPDDAPMYEHKVESNRVFDAGQGRIVNQVLTGVFTKGTATSAQVSGHPMAGKTGTTDSDAWGIMYPAIDRSGKTQPFVFAAWAGYPDNRKTNGNLWGANVMKIGQSFAAQMLAHAPRINFAKADMNAGKIVGLNAKSQTPGTPAVTTDSHTQVPSPTKTTQHQQPTPTRTSARPSPSPTTTEAKPQAPAPAAPAESAPPADNQAAPNNQSGVDVPANVEVAPTPDKTTPPSTVAPPAPTVTSTPEASPPASQQS